MLSVIHTKWTRIHILSSIKNSVCSQERCKSPLQILYVGIIAILNSNIDTRMEGLVVTGAASYRLSAVLAWNPKSQSLVQRERARLCGASSSLI